MGKTASWASSQHFHRRIKTLICALASAGKDRRQREKLGINSLEKETINDSIIFVARSFVTCPPCCCCTVKRFICGPFHVLYSGDLMRSSGSGVKRSPLCIRGINPSDRRAREDSGADTQESPCQTPFRHAPTWMTQFQQKLVIG